MNTPLKAFITGLVVMMGVGTLATTATATTLRPRTVLLHDLNVVRAAHGLRAVSPARLLRLTAQHHSDDMIIRDYFSHTAPGGGTLFDRITRSGFVSGWSRWEAGETLAWGVGSVANPGQVVRSWLASPEHRAIMLSSTWTRIGISRACGTFLGHTGSCVWTADWVRRW
jgi:uncharacterized protein YkwD